MLSIWNVIFTIFLIPIVISNSTSYTLFNPGNIAVEFNDNEGRSIFRTTTIANSPATRLLRAVTRSSGVFLPNTDSSRRSIKRIRNAMMTRKSGRTNAKGNSEISFSRRYSEIPSCDRSVMGICENEPQPLIPVCDNANQTHRSACALARFSCDQMRSHQMHPRILVHVGPCNLQSPVFTSEDEECPVKCPQNYKPVCDTRQRTYPNLCTFQKYNCGQRKNNEGTASFLYALMACNETLSALPDVNDNQFRDSSSTEVLNAKQQFECPKLKTCAGLRQPVCDSDGRWHRNQCTFLWSRCMAARRGRQLSVADGRFCVSHRNHTHNSEYEGEGDGSVMSSRDGQQVSVSRSCYRKCPVGLAYQPICATSFVTYPNLCQFHNAKCRDRVLEQLFYGECRDCLATACSAPAEDEPDSNYVCDQAGQTKTKCEFEMMRCIYERKFGYNITAAYSGRCCPTEDSCVSPGHGASQSQQPVCDSRNVTHPNRCYFEVYKCRAEKIAHHKITLSDENGGCTAVPSGQIYSALQDHSKTTNIGAIRCDAVTECDERYEPVCGSDGITYANRCRLDKSKCHNKTLSLAYNGECCLMQCEQQWAPICDDRNVTHMNLCVFSLHNCISVKRDGHRLRIVSYTTCPDDQCSMNCQADDYQPVCASNGVTYRNKCELNNVICEKRKSASNVFVKQQNEQIELELDYIGECCEDITAKCNSSAKSSPLCDSEGHTHGNLCEFEQAACLSRRRFMTNLTIQYWGQCCKNDCQNELPGTALCDNTQRTHENWCKFRLAQCESHRRNGRTLQLAHMGECCRLLRDDKCSKSGPLCDTDATTHADLCAFRHKQCLLNRTQHRTIMISYYGKCCTTDKHCGSDWIPVCDQHGITYQNRCHFDIRKCFLDRTSNTTLILTECREKSKFEIFSTTIGYN